MHSVEQVAPWFLGEARICVARDELEADRGAADGVDQLLEAEEVDVDDVIDRDTQLLGDRGGKHVGPIVVRRVDAILLA